VKVKDQRKTGRRRLIVRRAAAVVLAAAASFGAWLYVSLYVPVGGGRQATRFNVPEGASLADVADELKASGLIRSARAFRLAAAWGDGWRQAKAGDYALRRDMSAIEIARAFERGDVISEWVTVPEGLPLWQVAALVESRGLDGAEELLRAAESPPDLAVGFPLPPGSLEGYLFPDTYKVARHPGASRELVKMMLARFDEVVWRGLLDGRPPRDVAGVAVSLSQETDAGGARGRGEPSGAGAAANSSSLHALITLASLVEGEAKLDSERPLIAGVLTNRLKQGMKLECDATVQYALGPNRKARLTYADLAVESPYNTYLYPGLPPGPISSPGRASIEAALHPAVTPYLFYVARADGSHVFSRSYAEHLRAVARVRAAPPRRGSQ